MLVLHNYGVWILKCFTKAVALTLLGEWGKILSVTISYLALDAGSVD